MKGRFWVLHYISGGILFVLLLGHIFMMHFYKFLLKLQSGLEPLEWEAVVERAKNVSLTTLYILFLLFALFHGLYGLKNILIETNFGRKFEKQIVFVFWIIGIILFAFGTFTTIKAGGVG